MKIRITATIKNIDEENGITKVNVKIDKDNPLTNCYMDALYEAILNSMKAANKDAFYDAMDEFINKELQNEN